MRSFGGENLASFALDGYDAPGLIAVWFSWNWADEPIESLLWTSTLPLPIRLIYSVAGCLTLTIV